MLTENSEFLQSINHQRTKIFAVLEQAPLEALNWAPTNDETNSMYVIGTHVIGSEHGWIYEILGNGEKTRKRSAEFLVKGNGLDSLRVEYQRVAQQTEQVLAGLTEADMTTLRFRESHGDVTVRWILLHVIEHSSEHLGQLELTLQMWEHNSKN